MKLEKLLSSLALLLVLLPGSVAAQRAATEKQGFNSKGAFQIGEVDHVSLFNGSVVVALPIGPTYPVSPSLSYGLQLVYSSTAGWESVACPEQTFMPDPDPLNNAGFAWRLSLGRLGRAPSHPATRWVYDSPDGGRHGLYGTLHPGYPAAAQSNVYYSNDGTYLRMRYFASSNLCESPAGATNECLLLEQPNGVVHEFRKVRTADDGYRLTRMRDPFGHHVAVSYTAASWRITDSEGRTQVVEFAGPPFEYQTVARARLTAFGGAEALYELTYASRAIERRDFLPATCSLDNDKLVTVQLLDRLVLPDDSHYDFDYNTLNSAPEYLPGGLKSLRPPTGGEIRWQYTRLRYQSQPPEGRDRDVQTAYPLLRKETALTVGGTAIGTWSYAYAKSSDQVPGDTGPIMYHRETHVTDPLGNETVHYFSTSNFEHLWSYGLAFTRCAPGAGYVAAGPFLSSEVYEGSAATGTKLRSVYVEYGSDGNNVGGGESNQEKNHRLSYRKTVYHDDADKHKEMAFSDFDGLGKFRTRTEAGNLSAQDDRTATADYNAGHGTLVVDPETSGTAGSTFVLPATNAAWLFTTYTRQEVTAAGDTAVTEACFDPATGFLERARVLAAGTRSSVDLLTVFEQEEIGGDPTGRVARELLYGGDDAGAMDTTYSSLCDMTLPATPGYRTDHTYGAGVLATSTAIDPCDGTAVLSLTDRTIDAGTGLVSRSRDAAGVETVLVYDTRGRLTSERPAESTWTAYVYRLPTQAEPARVPRLAIKDCANGSTGCNAAASLTWQRVEYDGLGRPVTERIRIPEATGIVEKTRTTAYNALGWNTTESVWGDASKVTKYEDFDPFGRVGKITPPGQPATELTYEGERVKTCQTQVMLASGQQEAAYTTETYDARGRLLRVCENQSEPWSGTCAGLEASYLYDVGSRLTRVCSDKSGSECGQIRRFVYDHQSFLTQERHPEIGVLETAAAPEILITDPDGFEELEALDAGND